MLCLAESQLPGAASGCVSEVKQYYFTISISLHIQCNGPHFELRAHLLPNAQHAIIGKIELDQEKKKKDANWSCKIMPLV